APAFRRLTADPRRDAPGPGGARSRPPCGLDPGENEGAGQATRPTAGAPCMPRRTTVPRVGAARTPRAHGPRMRPRDAHAVTAPASVVADVPPGTWQRMRQRLGSKRVPGSTVHVQTADR